MRQLKLFPLWGKRQTQTDRTNEGQRAAEAAERSLISSSVCLSPSCPLSSLCFRGNWTDNFLPFCTFHITSVTPLLSLYHRSVLSPVSDIYSLRRSAALLSPLIQSEVHWQEVSVRQIQTNIMWNKESFFGFIGVVTPGSLSDYICQLNYGFCFQPDVKVSLNKFVHHL